MRAALGSWTKAQKMEFNKKNPRAKKLKVIYNALARFADANSAVITDVAKKRINDAMQSIGLAASAIVAQDNETTEEQEPV